MAELYSDIPQFSAEQDGVLRRRKIAEMMQAQSMQPINTPQPQRGFAVHTSPLEGIAKIVQAYMANKGIKEADTAQTDLATRAQGMMTAEQQKVADAMTMQQEQARPSPDMAGPMPMQAPTLDTQSSRLAGLNLQFPQARDDRNRQEGFVEKARTREDVQAAALAAKQATIDAKNDDSTNMKDYKFSQTIQGGGFKGSFEDFLAIKPSIMASVGYGNLGVRRREADYNLPSTEPNQSSQLSMSVGGKTYSFKDQKSLNKFKSAAGVQ